MADTAETTEKAKLINDIVNMEWDFFQKTQNVGGRADCQDQPVTFGIMRRSQFRCWSEDTLAQYRSDLLADRETGFNPVTGKYAYMMQWTHPDEFEQIRGSQSPQNRKNSPKRSLPSICPGRKSVPDSIPMSGPAGVLFIPPRTTPAQLPSKHISEVSSTPIPRTRSSSSPGTSERQRKRAATSR